MILSEFHLGEIAIHNLMNCQSKFKIDKNLSLRYLVERTSSWDKYTNVFFDHAYTDGLKLTQYIGDEFYELHIGSIKHIKDDKKHLFIYWVLTHITADQQQMQTYYTSHVENMNLETFTIKSVLSFVTELFNSHAEAILDVLKNGIDESLFLNVSHWSLEDKTIFHMMKTFGLAHFSEYQKGTWYASSELCKLVNK